MAAQIIEERPEDDNQENLETQQQEEQQDDIVEEAQEQEPTQDDDDLPDKYRGKTASELARMHQEAEKLLGRQSSEVGELRKVVDSYIQTQLSQQQRTTQTPDDDEDDIDETEFFVNPKSAVDRMVAKHPKIREAEQVTQQYKQQSALAQLQKNHPDMQEILRDAKFADWIKASKIRTQLFVQADQMYDHEAADELFTLWKDRKATVAQTANAEKTLRKATAKTASTGNARGNPDSNPRKIYRRADIIKLMKNDPDRYMAMSDEIQKAYQEGRVK